MPLRAIGLLKKRLGDEAAVCGKVFGSWTQAYHYFGVEHFLMGALDDPDATRRILDRLLPVTLAFAAAQIEAGADCILLADHVTRDCAGRGCTRIPGAAAPAFGRRDQGPGDPAHLRQHVGSHRDDRRDRPGLLPLGHEDRRRPRPAPARSRLALMGGVSNYKLLRGKAAEIAADAALAAQAGINIVGPECAIPLTTPLANLLAIVPGPYACPRRNRHDPWNRHVSSSGDRSFRLWHR